MFLLAMEQLSRNVRVFVEYLEEDELVARRSIMAFAAMRLPSNEETYFANSSGRFDKDVRRDLKNGYDNSGLRIGKWSEVVMLVVAVIKLSTEFDKNWGNWKQRKWEEIVASDFVHLKNWRNSALHWCNKPVEQIKGTLFQGSPSHGLWNLSALLQICSLIDKQVAIRFWMAENAMNHENLMRARSDLKRRK